MSAVADSVFAYVEAGTFDGNLTAFPSRWIFAEEDFDGVSPRAMRILTEMTLQGEISWVVFVPSGYRL